MKRLKTISRLFAFFLFAVPVFPQANETLRYNFEYGCNKERIVVGRCRHDSDMPGFAPTKPEDDYCQVYYPDRPKMGGFEAFGTVLRADVIKTLSACGAFTERQATQASSGTSSASKAADPDVEAANVLALKGNEQLTAKNTAEANRYFEAAIVKFKTAVARGSDLHEAYVGLGVIYVLQQKFDLAIPVWKKAIAIKPGDAGDSNHLGVALLAVDQNAEAAAAFEKAAQLDPQKALYHFNLASAYLELGRFDDARREAGILSDLDGALAIKLGRKFTQYQQNAANKEPNKSVAAGTNKPATGNSGKNPNQTSPKGNGKSTDAAPVSQAVDLVAVGHYEKGKQFWEAEEYAKTIPELEKAIAMNMDKDRLGATYIMLGDSYNLTRQYTKTIALMLKAIALEKEPTFYRILGDAYERTLQFAKALPVFKEAVRLDPKKASHLASLGSNYILNGRPAEAKQIYATLLTVDAKEAGYLLDEINNKEGAIGILTKRGTLGLIGRDKEEALEWFHNALKLNPTNTATLFDISSGFGICGKHDEALAVLRRIVASKPKPEDLATAHYFIGKNYNGMKDHAKALPELIEANRLHPSFYTKYEIGITYLNTKQFPKALAAFQEASKRQPKDADAYIMIGRTFVEMGQIDNAVAALQELVKLDPKSNRAWIEIGKINFEAKRYPDAGRAYSTALRLDAKSTLALFGIGKTYAALGRKPEAMRAYAALKPLDEKLAQELLNEIHNQ